MAPGSLVEGGGFRSKSRTPDNSAWFSPCIACASPSAASFIARNAARASAFAAAAVGAKSNAPDSHDVTERCCSGVNTCPLGVAAVGCALGAPRASSSM